MARRIIQPIIEETKPIEQPIETTEEQKEEEIFQEPIKKAKRGRPAKKVSVVADKEDTDETVEIEEDEKQKKQNQKQLNVDTWGNGFTDKEYEILNRKLNEFVKYYPLRTAMHREALITYLKYAQMRDKAIENDMVEEADKWGKLAAKQAQDAKINPSQLSLADLSNGIANVGKIVEAVEKVEDVIPILPQFIRQPRDEVDYTIWLYVQYCQRMTNMPECSYEDIYKFVLDKYNHNKKDYAFLVKEENKRYKETI